MRKLLGAHPTAERAFTRSDVLTAYAEVYANGRPDAMSASIARASQLSRARPVDMTLSPADAGRFEMLAQIPLRELQPADYVVTFESRVGRQTRQVLFSVTDR